MDEDDEGAYDLGDEDDEEDEDEWELEEMEHIAATLIQAIVRGYLVRCEMDAAHLEYQYQSD